MAHQEESLLHVLEELLACQLVEVLDGKVNSAVIREPSVQNPAARVTAHELIEHVDAAAQLLDLYLSQYPRPDSLLNHVVLILTSKCLPLLDEVLLSVELCCEVLLFVRYQPEVLGQECAQELACPDSIVFEYPRQSMQVLL